MKMTALLKKIQVLIVCILTVYFLFAPVVLHARTVDEINAEIKKTQEELAALKKQLAQASNNVSTSTAKKNNSTSEIAKVKNQLLLIKQTYDLNLLQQKQLENEIIIKNLEQEEQQNVMDVQIVDTYINWKTEDLTNTVFGKGGDIIKNVMYFDFLSKQTEQGLLDLGAKIEGLNTQSTQFQDQVAALSKDMNSLNEQKVFLERQIVLYDQAIAQANSLKNQLTASSSQLEEQQKQYNVELEIAVAAANSGSKPLISGQMYFAGSVSLPRNGVECTGSYKNYGFNPSTEAVGHGIGMSQWGAQGMAYAGKNATQILTFYYQGTSVQTRPAKNIMVGGATRMTMEEYVSGLGETADKACGNLEQITAWNNMANQLGWAQNDARREKYLLGGNCWPEEAIKAQVIAARTYAYNRADSICTTDACQVYKGGSAKAWAAYETKDLVIVNGNTVIDAFYSAYNNNGRGTANIETAWPKSSPRSYLVSVNDNSQTTTPRFCNQNMSRQNWRTNSYSIDSIKQMLAWAQEKSNWGDYNYVEPNYWNADVVRKQINNVIGNLQALQMDNDASGRAKRVKFIGSNGTGSVSGQFFRMMFNTWAGKKGLNDGLKSITYDIAVAQ